MKLLRLLLLCVLAPLRETPAAELERVIPSGMKLRVVPNARDARPSLRRLIEVEVYNGAARPESIVVRTFWMTDAGPLSRGNIRTYTLQAYQSGESYNVDSLEVSPGTRLTGWVVTVRRAQSKELLAVKGSPVKNEALARTPGALVKQ